MCVLCHDLINLLHSQIRKLFQELKNEGYDLGNKVLTEDSFLEAFKKLN